MLGSWLINLSVCYRSVHVTIEVGPNKQAYVIHKGLLTFYSDYFRAALDSTFKEAIDSKVSLPDEREDLFDIFNQFVYRRVVTNETESGLSTDKLVEVWLFGDRYMIPCLQNSAMDALILKINCEKTIPTNRINEIWGKTLPSSPLRKYILERVAYKLDVTTFLASEHQWTREALLDLVATHINKDVTTRFTFPARAKCYFHVHQDGQKC
jgi:hypothetical protein